MTTASSPVRLDAHLDGELSRGLVLVKWWLLAIPHYLVVAFFAGGGGFVLWQWGRAWSGPTGGLITLLALLAKPTPPLRHSRPNPRPLQRIRPTEGEKHSCVPATS